MVRRDAPYKLGKLEAYPTWQAGMPTLLHFWQAGMAALLDFWLILHGIGRESLKKICSDCGIWQKCP
jgi:hypothetical protein